MDIKGLIESTFELDSEKEFKKAYALSEKLNKSKSYIEKNIVPSLCYRCDNEEDIYDDQCAKLCGCSINVVNKNINMEFQDMSILTLVNLLSIKRFYSTKIANDYSVKEGIFGVGFTFSFDIHCFINSTDITFKFPVSKNLEFEKQGESYVNKDEISLSEIVKDNNGKEIILLHENLFYVFDNDGTLRKIENRNGNYVEIRYIPNTKNIKKIVSSGGKYLNFEYENNKVKSIRDNIGRTCRYFYDGNLLTVVEMPNGAKCKYEYDSKSEKINKIIDVNRNTSFAAKFNRNGEVTELYKGFGMWYKVERNEKFKSLKFQSDDQEITYEYERRGLVKRVTNKLKSIENKKDEWVIVQEYEYDSNKNIKRKTITKKGTRTIFEYDYNSKNQISEKRYTNENTKDNLTETYEYNDKHQLFKVKRNSGYEKIIYYDKRFNVIETKELVGIGFNIVCSFEYDSVGRLKSKTDGNKNKINYIFDLVSTLYPDRVIYPNGSIIQYRYDEVNRMIEKTEGKSTIEYKYNNIDKIVRNIRGDGVEDFNLYNNLGNIKEIVLPKEIKVSKNENRTAKKYLYVYDERNNLIKIINPDKENIYLGNSSEAGDENNNKESDNTKSKDIYKYNYVGNITECYIYVDTIDNKDLYKYISYEYDKNLNIKSKIESSEIDILFKKPTSYITTTFEYDNRNNMIRKHCSSGKDIIFFYTGINTLLKETIKVNLESDYITMYDYNTHGMLSKKYDILLFCDAQLDGINTENISNIKITTSYDYDENGNLIKIILPNREEKTINYNDSGILIDNDIKIYKEENMAEMIRCMFIDQINKDDAIKNVVYDKFGRIIKIINADGKYVLLEYDNADNITKYTDTEAITTEYIYNSINKIKTIKTNSATKEYKYDILKNSKEVMTK